MVLRKKKICFKCPLDEKRGFRLFMLILIFSAVPTLILPPPSSLLASGQVANSIPMVSTRGHFDLNTGELLPPHNLTDYKATNVPGLQTGSCPKELVIFVHGIWVDGRFGVNALENFTEMLDRLNMSLAHNVYRFPVVGFSWDSNTTISPDGSGWNIGKLLAKDNGPKLAQFILDYMNTCKEHNQDTKVRLVGHSMGARVILSSLQSLDTNQDWNRGHFKIASVDLLGAAVDNEEVSTSLLYIVRNPSTLFNLNEWFDPYGIKSAYGKAIEDVVLKFYNLYNPEDKISGDPRLYQFYDQDVPLGLDGAQAGISLPANYIQIDVQDKIAPSCDANGDHSPDFPFEQGQVVGIGDNHAAYIGSRDLMNNRTIIDDGAIGVVISNWNNSTLPVKQFQPSTTTCQ
jgi:pimeloyl-ACP methyl ester carboxylesterase